MLLNSGLNVVHVELRRLFLRIKLKGQGTVGEIHFDLAGRNCSEPVKGKKPHIFLFMNIDHVFLIFDDGIGIETFKIADPVTVQFALFRLISRVQQIHVALHLVDVGRGVLGIQRVNLELNADSLRRKRRRQKIIAPVRARVRLDIDVTGLRDDKLKGSAFVQIYRIFVGNFVGDAGFSRKTGDFFGASGQRHIGVCGCPGFLIVCKRSRHAERKGRNQQRDKSD